MVGIPEDVELTTIGLRFRGDALTLSGQQVVIRYANVRGVWVDKPFYKTFVKHPAEEVTGAVSVPAEDLRPMV